MADTAVVTDANSDVDQEAGLWGPYWISPTTAVIISINDSKDVAFQLTTNAGVNWAETTVKSDITEHVAVCFDQETPGDTGTLLHVLWAQSDTDGIRYRTVDISDGSLGTERTLDSGAVSTSSANVRIAITKTLAGELIAAWDNGTAIGCLRSTDGFATSDSIANPYEGSGGNKDYLLLFPANISGNPKDAVGIFWDASANEISIKMYDESADTWTEMSIATGMAEDGVHINMDGAVRHSDNHILLAAHSNDDSSGDDLRTWDINPDSISSPTVTAKTNIFTDQGESAQVAIFINQQNGHVYVAYLKGGTWQTSVDVVYHKSTDGMGIWDSESAYSEAAAANIRRVSSGRTVGNDGGFYQPAFFNDSDRDIFVNLVNDVAIAAAVTDDELLQSRRMVAVP